jgi:hypothetical protein
MNQKNAKAIRRVVRTEGVDIIRGFLADVCKGSLKSRLRFAWRIILKKF